MSQWGHDFRPDYFRLGDVARALGARSIFAATATATPRVRSTSRGGSGSATRCGSRPASTGPTSPTTSSRWDPRGRSATRRWRCSPSPTRCRRSSTPDAQEDRRDGGLARARSSAIPCPPTTPGWSASRGGRPTAFMSGEAPVVVATNAFGMGVDKADVRTVVHEVVPSLARGLLPGGRPRGARRPAVALRAARREPRQGPARVLHQPDRPSRRRRTTAGASTERSGGSSRARRAGGGRSCSISVIGSSPRRWAGAVTCVMGRSPPRSHSPGRGRGRSPRATTPRSRTGDPRRRARGAEPSVDGRGPSRSCAAGGARRCASTTTTSCPVTATTTTGAPTICFARWTR